MPQSRDAPSGYVPTRATSMTTASLAVTSPMRAPARDGGGLERQHQDRGAAHGRAGKRSDDAVVLQARAD
jgi:hypothetical protein